MNACCDKPNIKSTWFYGVDNDAQQHVIKVSNFHCTNCGMMFNPGRLIGHDGPTAVVFELYPVLGRPS